MSGTLTEVGRGAVYVTEYILSSGSLAARQVAETVTHRRDKIPKFKEPWAVQESCDGACWVTHDGELLATVEAGMPVE